MRYFFIGSFILLLSCVTVESNSDQKDTTLPAAANKTDPYGNKASLLSAFFGLDNALPFRANKLCKGARGKDGMPVIFSHELDIKSIQAGDFAVTLSSGKKGRVWCVTPAPATDKGELRTILLIGEFGSPDNPPAKVAIVGNILSIDRSINFREASIEVVPLEKGPSLVTAEIIPLNQWELRKKSTTGQGCPLETLQMIRVTWEGGVTKPGGKEIDALEAKLYEVQLEKKGGGSRTVTPIAISDLGDNDNNHELCILESGLPLSVFFPAGHLTDPREDLNPNTWVEVSTIRLLKQ